MYCLTYSTFDAFPAINNISLPVNNFNSTSVFFKHACHANHVADKELVGLNSYISTHLFRKLSNTSARNSCHFERANRDTHLNFFS